MIRFYVRTKTRKNQISLNRLKNILPVNRLAHREGVKVEVKKKMIIKYCCFSSPFNLSLFLTIFDLSSFFFRLRKSKLLFHVDEFSLGTIQLFYEETKNQTY